MRAIEIIEAPLSVGIGLSGVEHMARALRDAGLAPAIGAVAGNAMAAPYNARTVDPETALPEPESLGVLIELESALLASHYTQAHVAAADSTFIGYSPRGLQLRVSYFEGARLFAPMMPANRIARSSLP